MIIKKTTTFTLGMIFSLGLCMAVTPLNALSLFSKSNKGADIIGTLHRGFTGILHGQTDADIVISELKAIDAEVGKLIEALLTFLVKEFRNDSSLIHDKLKTGIMVEDFCIKYFAKLGLVKSMQYKGILDQLKTQFSTYTPEQFKTVIHTLHGTMNLPDVSLSADSRKSAIAGTTQIVKKHK